MTEAQRVGLTTAEVAEKVQQGFVNDADRGTSRSITDIIYANFFSLANVILLAIVLVLFAVNKPADALVTGGIVFINVFVGSFQEYRSKLKLDQIALLTRPKVQVIRDNQPQEINQEEVVVGDVIVIKAGDQMVVDGKVLQDPRSDKPAQRIDMDESLLTGESDLIPKYPNDEILSGSFCVVGEGLYIAEKVGEDSFAQKLTSGARQYTRVVTPLQRQISVIVRLLAVVAVSLTIILGLAKAYNNEPFSEGVEDAAVIISLVPQGLLLMVTVAYALGAVRIAAQGALVQQSNAVESISHVDVLCLDKTGTLTTNRILYHAVHPFDGIDEVTFKQRLGNYISSIGSPNKTAEAIAKALTGEKLKPVVEIPFSSARKWAAASFEAEQMRGTYILGAPTMIMADLPQKDQLEELAKQGLRVLLFAHSETIVRAEDIPADREPELPPTITLLGFITFTDELRPNVQNVLNNFRRAGVKLKLISGDDPVTVAALARQAGFSDKDKLVSGLELASMDQTQFEEAVRATTIFGRITPEQKKQIVDALRKDGHYVAMMGDGVNDVLSLKQAQVGIAMEDGSQATRSVADIVLLGNKFEALPHAFLEGQRIINGMDDVIRIFLTRTFYTILLIVAAGFINTEFPFTPRHNFLLTTFAVGIPAFFLMVWAKTGVSKKSLLVSASEFVLPTGISMAIMTLFVWVLYKTSGNYNDSSEVPRTVLTAAAFMGGLLVIWLAGHELEEWQTGEIQRDDPRRFYLMGVLFVCFLVVMSISGVREFFEMATMSWADIFTVAGAMIAWGVGLYLMVRFELLERILIPDYATLKDTAAKPKS